MPQSPTSDRLVLVGYGMWLLAQLDVLLPPRSVVLVEDPDLVVKRDAARAPERFRCVDRLVVTPYHGGLDDEDLDRVVHEVGRVDGVLAGFEYGVLAAAQVAERLGLPGAGVAAARMLTDKLQLRAAAAAGGVPCPRWQEVTGPAEVAGFRTGSRTVLKPANRHASLGVQVLQDGDDVDAAWERTVNALDAGLLPDRRTVAWRYMVEEYVEGPEISTEALVRDGEIVFHNITAKRLAGAVPVELGHTVPASHSPERIRSAMDRLVAATGFRSGALHAEWKLTADGPVLIECAGRFPGDHIVELIDLAYGCSLTSALVALLTGGTPTLPTRAALSASVEFLVADPGVVVGVDGVDSAQKAPGVHVAEVGVEVGGTVGPLTSSWDRVGHVIAVGADPAESYDRAAGAVDLISVTTQPPS